MANTDEFVLWLVRAVTILLVVGVLVFLLNGSIERNLALDDMKFYPVAQRILYSDTCFVYTQGERPYPGIINYQRYNQENIDNCFDVGTYPIGAKITLSFEGNQDVIYVDEEHYNDLAPLTFSQSFSYHKQRYYVLVYDEEQFKPANILVEVVWET